MTASEPRSSISVMRCQRRPCSRIHSRIGTRRPVAAQADLDEVPAEHRARFDEPAHRRPVAGELAVGIGSRVRVGVEVDDADAARPANLGDRARARPGDGVVAAEDDRDRAGRRDLTDLAVDHRVAALPVRRDDVRVAGVDDRQLLERADVELERVEAARGVLRLADRPWAEPRPRPVRDHVIERRPNDRDVDAAALELRRIGHPRQVGERRGPDVARQVEVAVHLELAVPAPLLGEATGSSVDVAEGRMAPGLRVRMAERIGLWSGTRLEVAAVPVRPGVAIGGIPWRTLAHVDPSDRAAEGCGGRSRSTPPVRIRRPAGRRGAS